MNFKNCDFIFPASNFKNRSLLESNESCIISHRSNKLKIIRFHVQSLLPRTRFPWTSSLNQKYLKINNWMFVAPYMRIINILFKTVLTDFVKCLWVKHFIALKQFTDYHFMNATNVNTSGLYLCLSKIIISWYLVFSLNQFW